MTNKFPIGQSFQRLTDSPLDATLTFDTLAQAQDYASNNPTAYEGQIIHIIDARTDKEIADSIESYEQSCYIDPNKEVKPICLLSDKSIDILYDIIEDILNKTTGNTKDKLNYFHELTTNGEPSIEYPDYSIPDGLADYRKEPWNPNAYTDMQICLKMNRNAPGDRIGGSNKVVVDFGRGTFTVNNYTFINQNGEEEYYKIVTVDQLPRNLEFAGGTYIEKIIKICDTSNVTDMDWMFSGCPSLTYINTSNLDTSKVTTMQQMFADCPSLTELDISHLDVSKVTMMHGMFEGCSGLTSLDFSKWEPYEVTWMAYMFQGCTSLKSLDLSSFYTPNLTTADYMFNYCPQLAELNLDNFNLNRATANCMFHGCNRLYSSDDISMANCSEVTKEKINNALNSR